MSLPRILIVDDYYARDASFRDQLCQQCGLADTMVDGLDGPVNNAGEYLAKAVFCSGQRDTGGQRVNDPDVVFEHIEKAWPPDKHSRPWAMVLLDVHFVSGTIRGAQCAGQSGDERFGEELHKQIKTRHPNLPVVLLTDKHENELTEPGEAVYLSKADLMTGDPARARAYLENKLLEQGRLDPEQTRHVLRLPNNVIALNPLTIQAFRLAKQLAFFDTPVLILGETGVGKEAYADFITNVSSRGHIEKINCAALPELLLESELFGHVRGAFTGADTEKRGLFEELDGGTIFLDEIGDMALATQAKLLRVIQNGEVRRVGDVNSKKVNVRIVAATNKNLPVEVSEKRFREDLYFRLNGAPILIPPLRERRDEIAALAEAFLGRFSAQQSKAGIQFESDALRLLQGYDYPGNVRELENLIERIVAQTGNNSIIKGSVVRDLLSSSSPRTAQVKKPFEHPAATAMLSTSPCAGQRENGLSPSMRPASEGASLEHFAAFIESIAVSPNDPALEGALSRVDAAIAAFRKRLAGASLMRFAAQGRGATTAAARFLLQNQEIRKSEVPRTFKGVLGLPKDKNSLSHDEIVTLLRSWNEGAKAHNDRDFDDSAINNLAEKARPDRPTGKNKQEKRK